MGAVSPGAWNRNQKGPLGTLEMVTTPPVVTLPGKVLQVVPLATRAATELPVTPGGAAGAVAPASGQ